MYEYRSVLYDYDYDLVLNTKNRISLTLDMLFRGRRVRHDSLISILMMALLLSPRSALKVEVGKIKRIGNESGRHYNINRAVKL